MKSLLCFWLAGFGLPHDAEVTSRRKTQLAMAGSSTHFHHALPLRSVDVRRRKYAINYGILPIQNTQIDHAEVARCTLSISCSTDLDNCVVFIDWVGVFLEHVHKILKASERFTSNFSVISLYIGCLLDLVASATIVATFTYNLNRLQASRLRN